MGWLEVLALLKRIAPLLGRLAPTLEAFLSTRGVSRADGDAAAERAANAIREGLAAAGQRHDALAAVLTGQAAEITAAAEGIRQLRATDHRNHVRMLELEASVDRVTRAVQALRTLVVGLLVLVAASTVLLAVLLLLHRSA